MYILSAEHGLLPAERIIEPYDRKMSEERSNELIVQVSEKTRNYDTIVFFKAGSNQLYFNCIRNACTISGVKFVSFGSKSMEGIGNLENIVDLCRQKKFSALESINGISVT